MIRVIHNPKKIKITDGKMIQSLIDEYNNFVIIWNEKESSGSNVSCGDEWSTIVEIWSGIYRLMFYKKSEQFRDEVIYNHRYVLKGNWTPSYAFKLKKSFEIFHPGLSCMKNQLNINDVQSVWIEYSGGDGVRFTNKKRRT